jgi:guanosine-3',5'-bis(diphosphate) 3'-pyrophosphohydrolase
VAELVSGALPQPDINLVLVALLHDTVEEAGVTNMEWAQRFGTDVADLVAEVTDDKSFCKKERKHLQILNDPHKSVRAQAIKPADMISNLGGILNSPSVDWDFKRKRGYFAWAKQVVDGSRLRICP